MTPFALPYDPAAAPVLFLIGYGYRPAYQPADYIGPRMDCPMWLPAPDADVAYQGKLDPWDHMPASGYAWGTWIPSGGPIPAAEARAAGIPGSELTSARPIPTPYWPPQPTYPCNCITTPPVNPPLPEPAPVPLPASAGLLIAAVAAFAIIRRKS